MKVIDNKYIVYYNDVNKRSKKNLGGRKNGRKNVKLYNR